MGNETQITQKMTVGVTGTTGILTLTRPKALNALDLAMYHLIDDALTAWEDEPAISQVLIVSGIDRAFCAGGDIRIITEGIDAITAQYATTPSSLVATADEVDPTPYQDAVR